MRAVIEAPLFGSRAWAAVRNDLCDYFFRFPPALLRFDDLTYVYEAEAMIWMHGLFIILCMYEPMCNPTGGRLMHGLDGTRDLVDLIMNPVYHKANRFSYLLEHSFLLGDVCSVVPEWNLQTNFSGSTHRPLSGSVLGKPLACYYSLPPPIQHDSCNSSSSILF